MQLGLSSYTYVWGVGVPGFPMPARPLTAADLVDLAASLGVRVLQLADNLPVHAMDRGEQNSLFGYARASGVQLELGTRGIDPAHLRAYVELALRAGAPVIRTLLDDGDRRPAPADAAALLRSVMPRFESAGVRLAIENHDRLTSAALVEVLERVDNPCLGICLDTANSLGCLEGTATVVETLGPHTVNLHVKDCRVSRLPHAKGFVVEGTPAGQGQVDIPAVLDRLRAFGRDPNAIVELWPPPEPDVEDAVSKEREWAEQSVRYMRQLLPA